MTVSNEKQIDDLEHRLNYTVNKFEEQNLRFQQCGRQLAEAYEAMEKHEQTIAMQNEEMRIMQEEMKELKGIGMTDTCKKNETSADASNMLCSTIGNTLL